RGSHRVCVDKSTTSSNSRQEVRASDYAYKGGIEQIQVQQLNTGAGLGGHDARCGVSLKRAVFEGHIGVSKTDAVTSDARALEVAALYDRPISPGRLDMNVGGRFKPATHCDKHTSLRSVQLVNTDTAISEGVFVCHRSVTALEVDTYCL